jgi:hypothetical protein
MLFENRVLRRIFGLKRSEVTGGWRKTALRMRIIIIIIIMTVTFKYY